MNDIQFEQLATIRAAVGYLGEKGQAAWWPSSFFGEGSTSFLAPMFARTQLVAQCVGVTSAASKVHDERIGVGQVYHLFRLPEDLERGIHQIMSRMEVSQRIKQIVATNEAATRFLRGNERIAQVKAIGPTRIADVSALREANTWKVVAVTYTDGFERGTECFPYFTDRK